MMRTFPSRWLAALAGLLSALLVTGCNLFDPIDTSILPRSTDNQVAQGRIFLENGEYSQAREVFQSLFDKGQGTSEVIQGLGEAQAGEAGFKVLTVLDLIQNSTAGTDRAPILFKTAKSISSRQGLEEAIARLMTNPDPTKGDRLTRGLMRVVAAVRLLLDKYDTNHNGRLEVVDQINYLTNDKTLPMWSQVYQELVTGPSTTTGATLEQAFTDLSVGFDGRGNAWTFLTPVNQLSASGTYSAANKATIQAVTDLVERLKTVHPFYQTNAASFSAAIRAIDGDEAL